MPPASMPRQQCRWAHFGDLGKAPFRGCVLPGKTDVARQLLRPPEQNQPLDVCKSRLTWSPKYWPAMQLLPTTHGAPGMGSCGPGPSPHVSKPPQAAKPLPGVWHKQTLNPKP